MERPASNSKTVDYAASRKTVGQTDARGRPHACRVCVACAHAAGLYADKHPTANVEPDGRGTARDVVAFTSGDGKLRSGIYKAVPEHEEYKSG